MVAIFTERGAEISIADDEPTITDLPAGPVVRLCIDISGTAQNGNNVDSECPTKPEK